MKKKYCLATRFASAVKKWNNKTCTKHKECMEYMCTPNWSSHIHIHFYTLMQRTHKIYNICHVVYWNTYVCEGYIPNKIMDSDKYMYRYGQTTSRMSDCYE
jgi:hypothetical protein